MKPSWLTHTAECIIREMRETGDYMAALTFLCDALLEAGAPEAFISDLLTAKKVGEGIIGHLVIRHMIEDRLGDTGRAAALKQLLQCPSAMGCLRCELAYGHKVPHQQKTKAGHVRQWNDRGWIRVEGER